MPDGEKIKRTQSTTGLFFATIVVIPFQVLLLILPLVGSYNALTGTVNLSSSNNTPYFIAYLVLTIVYCILMSLAFHPKRIVSPINVQAGTATIASLYLIYYILEQAKFTTTAQEVALVESLVGLTGILVIFLVALGIAQFLVVKWMVALNFESVDRMSFLINAKTEDVMKILDDEFIDVWGFSRRKENPKAKKKVIWVLKCRDVYGNRVVLTVGSHSLDENNCVLATVAFRSTLYSIESSKSASGMRASIINDITERLVHANPQLTLTQLDATDDAVSFKAYSQALAVTCPKTELTKEFFRNIPRYYLYGIAVTLLALVFMTIAFALKQLDMSTYVGAMIVLVVALIAEFGVSLHEELSKQEVEELD